MISSLKGIAEHNGSNPIIVDVGGVGYCVYVPAKLLSTLHSGNSCKLFIKSHIREDAFDLYGFESRSEIDLFEKLLTVSGIGPRTALLVVDRGVGAVHEAIIQADTDFFTSIPRLGKKNAQKIIIELKSKLGSITDIDLTDASATQTKDVLTALVSMGFAKPEALEAIRTIDPQARTLEEKVRSALKVLAKKL